MEIKKIKLLKLLILILLAIISLIVLTYQLRQRDDILMEMFIFPRYWEMRVYHFVVRNDGTFISRQGIAPPRSITEGNVWMFPLRRETIIISEQEIRDISDLLVRISGDDESTQWRVFGWQTFIILYDGNVYENSTACPETYGDLIYKMWQLSPLVTLY